MGKEKFWKYALQFNKDDDERFKEQKEKRSIDKAYAASKKDKRIVQVTRKDEHGQSIESDSDDEGIQIA